MTRKRGSEAAVKASRQSRKVNIFLRVVVEEGSKTDSMEDLTKKFENKKCTTTTLPRDQIRLAFYGFRSTLEKI